ncbi:DUF3043 domain-containing protein [Nocardioides sp. JQ2195]|uniref:DUF3043 domain-containing protein n=1 Tax=Nocardioides sp. JQ2195 TaxID=2592334 RepID=UPI00143E23BA|nr:DUF3043 domain-containing protein [Nocardioides sp. JQ2195]QIX26281.1 DUF3043 domain-containing protein [Nocardioides sp. JQ2195]
MFRRTTKNSTPDPVVHEDRPGSKGRPTPSRKDAEAAARARAKMPNDRKAQARRQRELRMESSQKVRQAMKTGDEAHLPPRDKGPVRRFIRDYVDSRLGFTELLAPLLLIIVLMGYGLFGSGAVRMANSLWFITLVLVIGDILFLRFRVRSQVRKRFPDESLKGVTMYAVMRAVNMRFLRLPKPQVKIGQALPEHYR